MLDGVGGYTCYGLIENCRADETPPGLPICFADNLTVKRSIARDEEIVLDDVEYDPKRSDFVLYQNALDASRRCRSLMQLKTTTD